MKYDKIRHWLPFLLAFWLLPTPSHGIIPTDSVDISLLTCSPHDEVYALYGHTALRIVDHTTREDIAVNYGVFSFEQPHFAARFVFGLTDYQMGVCPFELFCREYAYEGRSVTEQVLQLTPAEKERIVAAIIENSRPENLVYRYNFFYDNCTTRARDMVVSHLDGEVHYASSEDSTATFRSMTHDFNNDHVWARFGNDMLLGLQADQPTTRSERQFLPSNLESDFSHALVSRPDGSSMPLVRQTTKVLEAIPSTPTSEFPLRPRTCFWLLFALTVVITAMEILLHRKMWLYDALLLVVAGIAGLVLSLMLFSQHPTVRINLQMLVLNPLPLFLAVPIVKKEIRGGHHWWWTIWGVLCILFFFGAFLQDYAEGMLILASSLLLRCVANSRLMASFTPSKTTKATK